MMDIAEFFLDKYRRFTMMAEVFVPRPTDVEFPIWCSMSKRNCLKPIDKEVVYVLRVPNDQIVFFNGCKWDYVLNNLYIPSDPEDEKSYLNEIKKLGVRDEFNFLEGKYKGMFPEIDDKILYSWKRIFEIVEWDDFIVQANIWEIKSEWVKHILRVGDDIFSVE